MKLFHKSVDSIVADIVKKIEDLHVVKELKHLESIAHAELVEKYQKLQSAALQEKDRALAIAEKLTALINP